jgi:hypothetical protein
MPVETTLESLLNQIAQANVGLLTGFAYSWTVAVRLFEIADQDFLDRAPEITRGS